MPVSGRPSLVIAAVLGLGLSGLPGCASYTNMNTTAGVGSVVNPNARVPSDVVKEALRYVSVRYPVGDRFAVNLVNGTNEIMADFIMRDLPMGAELVSEDNQSLPTYHIGAVRVRGTEAKVDVIRPIVEMGELPGGGYATQGITVHLEGGMNPWRVSLIQRWAVGAIEVPERSYVGMAVVQHDVEDSEPITDTGEASAAVAEDENEQP